MKTPDHSDFLAALQSESPILQRYAAVAAAAAHVALTFAGLYRDAIARFEAMNEPQRMLASSIVADVCREKGIPVARIKSRERSRRVVECRWLIIQRISEQTSLSQGDIARLLELDTTSVGYAMEKMREFGGMPKPRWHRGPYLRWSEAERGVARRFAAREIGLDEALALLPGRTDSGLKTHARVHFGMRGRP